MAAIDWTPVDQAEATGTPEGALVAALEAVKLFEHRLTELRLPGGRKEERLAAAKPYFTRPADVEKVVKYADRVRHADTPALTPERGKEYVQAMRQAVADLNALEEQRGSLVGQLKVYLGLLTGKRKWVVRGAAGVGGFLLAVLLLSNTSVGRSAVQAVVDGVNALFAAVIIVLIGLVIIILVVLGTAFYLDRSKGGRIKDEDEH